VTAVVLRGDAAHLPLPDGSVKRPGPPRTSWSVEYFWERVQKTDSCWIWTRSINGNGYGSLRFRSQPTFAHRVAYQLEVGPIPDGFEVDHRCHDPKVCKVPAKECPHRRCCNPAHLEPVPASVNRKRGNSKRTHNSSKKRCPQGHRYDEKNTYISPNGGRQCRICRRARVRASRQAKRVMRKAAA
jgi:hypothetical protein